MYRLTSKKTNKVQYITDAEYERMKHLGWTGRYNISKMAERVNAAPQVIKPEEKKPIKKKKND